MMVRKPPPRPARPLSIHGVGQGPSADSSGFGLPTLMRCVPAPSNQGTQQRRVGRSSASGILPIWTNRRSPSGVLSPLQCRRELIPIPPGQGLCQASAQSFASGNSKTCPIAFRPTVIFAPHGLRAQAQKPAAHSGHGARPPRCISRRACAYISYGRGRRRSCSSSTPNCARRLTPA